MLCRPCGSMGPSWLIEMVRDRGLPYFKNRGIKVERGFHFCECCARAQVGEYFFAQIFVQRST
jgi:hypothetical protein